MCWRAGIFGNAGGLAGGGSGPTRPCASAVGGGFARQQSLDQREAAAIRQKPLRDTQGSRQSIVLRRSRADRGRRETGRRDPGTAEPPSRPPSGRGRERRV